MARGIILSIILLLPWNSRLVKGECTESVNAEGIITSPNFPAPYDARLKCETNIQAPANKVVKITVLDMDLPPPTGNGRSCKKENVKIHDGSDDRAPKIAKLCGTDTGAVFVTTQAEAYILFKSDRVNGGETGYRLKIQFVDAGGSGSSTSTPTTTVQLTSPAPTSGPASWYDGECGKSIYSNAATRMQHRIIGGVNARTGEFPWQIALTNGDWSLYCGGSLINERWVITAAHCMVAVQLQVIMGAHDMDLVRSGTCDSCQVRGISERYVHPSYDSSTLDYDIALLRLDARVNMSDEFVQPICPPDTNVDYNNREAFVSGWGTTNNGTLSDILQYAQLSITSQVNCQNEFSQYTITDRMICAIDDQDEFERDACQGDSGGPLVVKEPDGHFKLVGLVSWGIGCAAGTPGVYTRVGALLPWIQATID